VNTSNGPAAPTGSRIIAVLEETWAAIRERHPHVPPVLIVTGTAHASGGRATLGHFGADRWITQDGRLPELFAAGELLAGANGHGGGRTVLKTLLHEAAHGLAHTRGVKDCSRQNRYHNRRFAALATELGLTPPRHPDSVLGFSAATLEDRAADTWRQVIDAIDTARLPHGGALHLAAEPGPTGTDDPAAGGAGRAGTRLSVACCCQPPRSLAITPRQYETAPIVCGACWEPFTAPDT
jgi:hypothetical protein